ncbi:hypothetical protein [Chryseolinea sp. H1M3-3]|uniref:hypothetical protein n=1 Tax=Chryseolinea sp. H1M3-3 TaxID=3034144 RepID=UPI0023EB70B2|nr:hypothetical protein [Chryseolinea sp. H1M3-3]
MKSIFDVGDIVQVKDTLKSSNKEDAPKYIITQVHQPNPKQLWGSNEYHYNINFVKSGPTYHVHGAKDISIMYPESSLLASNL